MRTVSRSGFCAILAIISLLWYPGDLSAKTKKKKQEVKAESHNFFDFQDAPYFTSADKRVGAKILIDSTKVGPTLVSMQHLTFLPTAHIKSHRHVYVTEVVYVLKGNLVLRIGEQVKVMGPDTTAYIPPQTFHEYRNDSSDVCQFLQFFSPSGPEEEYRNWETPNKIVAQSSTPPAAPLATGPIIIQVPTAPIIPGSPVPTIDGVKRIDETTPAATDLKFELKEDAPAKPVSVDTPKFGSTGVKKKVTIK